MENFFVSVNNKKVKGIIENPNRKDIIILVHGFTGDMKGPSNFFKKFSLEAQEHGYSICRFDFRGTGGSEGKFEEMTINSEIEDLNHVINFIDLDGYENISLLGESMGGTIISGLTNFSRFKSIIFWYPAFDLYNTDLSRYLNNKNQKLLEKQGFIDCDGYNVGKLFIDEIDSINTFNNLLKIKCPTTLFHGDCDKEVPVEQSIKAINIIQSNNKRLHIIKGADHCFRNEQNEIIEKTLKFIVEI